ncbi:MAG: hypothetical protein AAB649_00080 [Patescibacteria group bacterium]
MNIIHTFKSIGAVLAGFLTVFILSIVTDSILEALGIFPPQNQPEQFVGYLLVVAFIYRSIYAVLGGYITAKLSPSNPMKHVIILGIIGTVGGIMGVIAGWNLSAHWYPIALAVTAFPLVYFGGKMKTSRE